MITNTRKTRNSGAVKKSRKDYYLLMIDHNPIGICTTLEKAESCALYYAEKYGGKKLGEEEVYIYEDSVGKHLIYFERIKRIKLPTDPEEE